MEIFENLCYQHISLIRKAFHLDHIPCQIGSWRHTPPKHSHHSGAQIDLLFDRNDGVISLCEIKYTQTPFQIDKAYAKQLFQKMDVFEQHTKTTKEVELLMITSAGLKTNFYSEDLIQQSIQLEALF